MVSYEIYYHYTLYHLKYKRDIYVWEANKLLFIEFGIYS